MNAGLQRSRRSARRPRRLPCTCLALALAFSSAVPAVAFGARGHQAGARVVPRRSDPVAKSNDQRALQVRVSKLRDRIVAEPKKRRHRFDLVQALQRLGRLDDALQVAKQWRQVDAYNLLAVRIIGDLYAQQGHIDKALRTWSAVVELLPEDAAAHRALASALKQAGQIQVACRQLRRASSLRPDDRRLRFEWADCLQRSGALARASGLFRELVDDPQTPRFVRGPARTRLALALGQRRREAMAEGRHHDAQQLAGQLSKLHTRHTSSPIKVFLSWDTDRSDIDLWVTPPDGKRVWYRQKKTRAGALFGDVTTGYGPEMFVAEGLSRGRYRVHVNYYGTPRRGLREARGEVVILIGEGTSRERRVTLPYRLYEPGQTVHIADIEVP